MKFLSKSLLAKLIIYFLLLSSIPILIAGYMAYDSERDNHTNEVESKLTSVAILKEKQVENWATHLKHTVEWLQNDPDLMRGLTAMTDSREPDQISLTYDSLVSHMGSIVTLEHFQVIEILDATTGEVFAATRQGWEGEIRVSAPYFVNGREGIFVSQISRYPDLANPTIVISAPIKSAEGETLAVVAGYANLEGLTDIMLERTGLGKTGETFLVNKDNLLLTNTVFAPDGAFDKLILGDGARWAISGQTGAGTFTDYRDKAVIGAYRWLPDLELALIAKQDQSEAFEPIRDLQRNMILTVGAIWIIDIILLAYLFRRNISHPLADVVYGAQRIGSGHFDYRVRVKGKDEMGKLGLAFNQMAQNLKEVTSVKDMLDREARLQKRMAKEREALIRQLESKNAELERFTYTVSHDLKNPLITIKGFVGMLPQDVDSGDRERFVADIGRITEAADRMARLLDELLELSRIGRLVNEFETVSMNDIAQEAISNLSGVLSQTGVRVSIEPDLPPVYGDRARLVTVLQNLIENAVKFTAGVDDPQVRIGVRFEEGRPPVYYVADNGIGIDPRYHHRVFGLFDKIDPQAEGTGVGLAIIQRIIEAHGGQIWVESEGQNRGTTFLFRLPPIPDK